VVDIQTVSITIASVGVFIATIYYILQIRHQTKLRQTDLFMRLYSAWGSVRFRMAAKRFLAIEVKNYDDFVKKHGPAASAEPSEIWLDIDRIGWFFNEIGFLVNERLINEKSVHKLLGYWVIKAWEKEKPLIYAWRKEWGLPESFHWFEYLYNEMKKREQKLQQSKA
jgi:hypothetical protein